MAELLPGLDAKVFGQLLWESMPPSIIDSLTFMLAIGKTIGILFIIYMAFLIVRAIVQTRQALRIKTIAESVESINRKLDLLIPHKSETHKEKEKKKELERK